jgi:hypothetical protein
MSGSSKQTQNQTQDTKTAPWAPQANAITTAFDGAKAALGTAGNAQAPTDFVAGMTPEQVNTFRNMLGFANKSGVSDQNLATGNTLASAGTAGATGALSGLLGFNPSSARDSIIGDANKYADNPHISGMVDAAMRDARNQVRDITLPGIERSAAVSGNVNNSRMGIAQGLVERELAGKAADVSSNLRGAAYDKGLDLGAMTNVQAVLDSLKSAGGLGGNLAQLGIGARSGAVDDAKGMFDIANTGGAGLQASQQLELDNLLARYQSGVSSPFDALNQYMGIVGSNNWGSEGTMSGTQTTKSTPSAWQVIGGLMGAGGSLMSGINGVPGK